jgi:hypothetical protein
MSTLPTEDSAPAPNTRHGTSDQLQERLAEAASYAVLRRIAPVLRHDIAGFMQPVGMLMMVLQRRVQMPEPDLQAIAKNVASVSALTKEATTGCMNAMGWMASREDNPVNLRGSVDEAAKLLTMELAANGITIANNIAGDAVSIPQSFFRSVLIGALLAFCDQRAAGNALLVSLETGPGGHPETSRLMLHMQPGEASGPSESPAVNRSSRRIDWLDVEAMAGTYGVAISRGEGWLSLNLPRTA